MKVKESLNVTFDETPPLPKTSPLEDDDLVEEEAIKVNKTKPLGNDLKDKSVENNEIINIKESKSHPLDNVIGNLNQRTLRSQAQDKSFKKESSEKIVQPLSDSEDEEYTHGHKNPKNFQRRGRFVRQPHDERKSSQRNKDDKNGKSERKCFKCGDPNHLIGECPKLSRNYNQRAFVGGSWSDSDEDGKKIR
ncbi:zf-CCHC domain-containing protein [Tanacetum coccineum]|uniref:Zf-CCHC domain-containing protein n=1 Tax=Tanacetum coccineum TaxID=301880 RepID=A0ABQ5EV75_9ASTR